MQKNQEINFTAEELKEEFKKDFYQIDYFLNFKINRRKRKEDISAIISDNFVL